MPGCARSSYDKMIIFCNNSNSSRVSLQVWKGMNPSIRPPAIGDIAR